MSRPKPTDASASLYCEIAGLPVEIAAGDLGAAGLFAKTTTPLGLETEVEIFLRSTAGSVTLRGHVVQVVDVQRAAVEHRAPGFGVLFAHLSAQARTWIESTLAAMPRPAPTHVTPRPDVTPERSPAATPPVSHHTPKPDAAAQPTPAATPPASHVTPRPDAAASLTPVPGRAPRVDPRVAVTLAVLERELESARGKAPWLLLGIDRDAPPDAARDAFLDASRRYHPHRFARYDSDEISRVATELFVVYKRAYATLVPGVGVAKRPDSGPLNLPDAGTEASTEAKPRGDRDGPTRRLRR